MLQQSDISREVTIYDSGKTVTRKRAIQRARRPDQSQTFFPGIQERWVDDPDTIGKFHILKHQDCEDILKTINELPSHVVSEQLRKSAQRLIGTVPAVFAHAWAKEWGCKLYGKEWLELAAKRLEHDGRYAKLKVDYMT